MKRQPGWRTRLHREIAHAAKKLFDWGDHDCVLFAAGDCVFAMTGEDPAASFRGTYSNAFGASRAIKAAGFDDLPSLVAAHFSEVHPSAAHFGDLMAVPGTNETGWALGICLGERIAVLGPQGLGTIARNRATRAFRVP
jgi:hypothetical protein